MSPYLACSQTQRKGVVVGEEEIYICRAPRSLRSDYFLFTKQRNAESSIFTFYVVVKMPAEGAGG